MLRRREFLAAMVALPAARAEAERNAFEPLTREASSLGKKAWQPMLTYLADLHRRGTHPVQPPFPYPWEDLGPGYHARAFGHWDVVHEIIDVLPALKQHAEWQIRNNLANQGADGHVPGLIWVKASHLPEGHPPRWNKEASHPPLWPTAVSDYQSQYRTLELTRFCYRPLKNQIKWFETQRKAEPAGFHYSRSNWESGIDDDVRQPFGDSFEPRKAFIDATCHVYQMYDCAAQWAAALGEVEEGKQFSSKAAALAEYVRTELYDGKSGFFYDAWSVHDPAKRVESFVAIWPLVFGIATPSQAGRLVEEHVMNPKRFYTRHPIASIVPGTRGYELLTWHGPAWNSMTYWAARGCLRYGFKTEARKLLETALDASNAQFARTNTIWEFFHPDGGRPEDMRREVKPPYEMPRRDYTGHNPLFAMARLLAHGIH